MKTTYLLSCEDDWDEMAVDAVVALATAFSKTGPDGAAFDLIGDALRVALQELAERCGLAERCEGIEWSDLVVDLVMESAWVDRDALLAWLGTAFAR